MSRFARAGNRVLYIENTGVRTVRLSDLPRVVGRLRNSLAERGGAREPAERVKVIAPLLAPLPRSRVARALNDRLLLPRLAGKLRALGAVDPVIMTFLPTPNALRLIDLCATQRSVVVYYCIADFQELSDLGADLARAEEALARRADLVFAQSDAFARRLSSLNAEVHEFQFGVNLEIFDPRSVPAVSGRITSLRRPIIGYSGGLHRHVDFGLVDEIARAFPEATVLLVGPLQTNPGAAVRARPNVRFLGALPITDLPAIVAGFDVAIIPYARTAYTDTVFPTKLYEYLAMGRPVVSTDLPEVRKLGLPDLAVRVGRDSREFVLGIQAALASDQPEYQASRIALAKERDWRAIVARMAELIAAKRS